MGDALAELLADITEAARTIGILLQDVQRARPSPVFALGCQMGHRSGRCQSAAPFNGIRAGTRG